MCAEEELVRVIQRLTEEVKLGMLLAVDYVIVTPFTDAAKNVVCQRLNRLLRATPASINDLTQTTYRLKQEPKIIKEEA